MSAEKSDNKIFSKEYEYTNITLRIILFFLVLTVGISLMSVGIGGTLSLIIKAILSSLIFILIWVILGSYLLRGHLKNRRNNDTILLPKENKIKLSIWSLILSFLGYVLLLYFGGISFIFELLIQLSLLMFFLNKMIVKQAPIQIISAIQL